MKIKDIHHDNAFYEYNMVSLDTENNLVNQNATKLSIHNPEKRYLVLSKEIGYFNKNTNFIVGEKESIIFINRQGEQCSPNISEVIQKPKEYSIVYPIPINNIETNEEIEIIRSSTLEYSNEIIPLTYELGKKVGKNMITKEYNDIFFKSINDSGSEEFWPNKHILINSNIDFLLGILDGYQTESYQLASDYNGIIPSKFTELTIYKNNNLYTFYTILNLLGAKYKITHEKTINNENPYSKKITVTFPRVFKEYFEENEIPFYTKKVFTFCSKDGFLKSEKAISLNSSQEIENLNNKIITGNLVLVSCLDIKFIQVDSKDEMYDFTMDRSDATNYALPFTPILKNSDGDILTISTIFSHEAIEDSKTFEPSNKKWFRNLNDGEISSFIKDDALLGLYAATKHLKK